MKKLIDWTIAHRGNFQILYLTANGTFQIVLEFPCREQWVKMAAFDSDINEAIAEVICNADLHVNKFCQTKLHLS